MEYLRKREFSDIKNKRVILTQFSMECFIGIEQRLLELRVFLGVAQTIVGSPW